MDYIVVDVIVDWVVELVLLMVSAVLLRNFGDVAGLTKLRAVCRSPSVVTLLPHLEAHPLDRSLFLTARSSERSLKLMLHY